MPMLPGLAIMSDGIGGSLDVVDSLCGSTSIDEGDLFASAVLKLRGRNAAFVNSAGLRVGDCSEIDLNAVLSQDRSG